MPELISKSDASQNVKSSYDPLLNGQEGGAPVEIPDLLIQPVPESSNASARSYAATLALLDKSLGLDYNESYKKRYSALHNLPSGEQLMYATQESKLLNRQRLRVNLDNLKLPSSLDYGIGTTYEEKAEEQAKKKAKYENDIQNLMQQAKDIEFSTLPLDEQLAQYREIAPEEVDSVDGEEWAKQSFNEMASRVIAKVGGNPDTWEYESTTQAVYEFGKSVILPLRVNIGIGEVRKKAAKYRTSTNAGKMYMLPEIEKAILEYSNGDLDIATQALQNFIDLSTTTKEQVIELAISPLYFTGFGLGARVKRGASAVSSLAGRGFKREAGELNARVLTEEGRAADIGVSTLEARVSADPVIGNIAPEVTAGLAPETVAGIEAARAKLTAKITEVRKAIPEQSPLSLDEQEAFIRQRMAVVPDAVTVESRDATGFVLRMRNGQLSQKLSFTRDGIGEMTPLGELGELASRTLSPSAWLTGTARANLAAASKIELVSEAFSYEFRKIFDEVLELKFKDRILTGMSSQEWKSIDDVLIQGDRMSRQYTARELTEGVAVEGTGVVALSERQIAKYYEMRHLYDELYKIRDDIYARDLNFRNYRGINTIVDGQPMRLSGKLAFTRTDANGLSIVTIPKDVKRIAYTDRTGLIARDVEARWVNDNSRVFVEFDKPVKIGNEYFTHGFVRQTELKGIDSGMLGYRQGYVPLYYRRVNYVVRQRAAKIVNGTKIYNNEVRRFFDTREEAMKFADDANRGITVKEDQLTVALDRDLKAIQGKEGDDYRQAVEEALHNGRYFAARGEEPIKYGASALETPRYGAIDSLNRYTRAMTWAYPQTAFRQRILTQFQNNYGKHLVDPTDWRSDFKSTASLTIPERKAITEYREVMKDWLAVRTEEETMFGNGARAIAEKVEGKLSSTKVEKIRDIANANIIGNIRGATHHALLGFYSGAQFFIQAMGLTIAASVDPINFAKALPRYTFLRATAYIHPSHANYDVLIEKFAKLSRIDVGEAREMAENFRKSGLARSLRNTSADYNAAENGLLVSRGMMGRVADSGLVFYREGELTNRIISHAIATLRAKALLSSGKATGDLLDVTMKEYYKVAFNLQRSNKAKWQSGWASIPTQYMQITAKYMEHLIPALIGKEGAQWTRTEALTSLGVGTMLFGVTGGVPLGGLFSKNLRNYVTGNVEDGGLGITDEKAAVAIEGGMVDLFLGSALGLGEEYASISSRAGLANGILETINRVADQPTVIHAIAGATGGFGGRVATVTSNALKIASPYAMAEDGFTSERMALAASELLDVLPGWRNVHIARLYYNNQAILSSNNQKLLDIESDPEKFWLLSDGAVFAKAIGFDVKARDWAREIATAKKDSGNDIREAVNAMTLLSSRLAAKGQPSETDIAILQTNLFMIGNSFENEDDKAKFAKQWAMRLKEDDKLTRDLKTIMEGSDVAEELSSNPLYNSTMSNPQEGQ